MNTTPDPNAATVAAITSEIMAGRSFRPADPHGAFPGDDPAAAVEEAVERAVARHLGRMPARFRVATLAGLNAEQKPGLLRAWLEQEDARTLLLGGEPGVGKSWAACAVAAGFVARWIRGEGTRQVPVAWWSVAGLLDALRPAGPDPEGLWERVKSVPLLVLDDLAHVRPTEWAAERVWLLVNARVESDAARTVVTTNATWQALAEAWGPGTMDRLRDGAASLVLDGPSLRRPVRLGGAR